MKQGRKHAGDLLAGALAGAAAVWAMDRLDWALYDRVDPQARRRTIAARPGGLDPAHVIANRAAHALGTELSPAQPHPAGIAVHYGLGAAMGAAYAALTPRTPVLGAGRGVLFGLLMFVVQDEGMNTLLGTAGPPGRYPWQAHARGAVAHGVFGFVLDALLRLTGRQ